MPGRGAASFESGAHAPPQVALHFARKLLRQQAEWERREFLAAWADTLPEVRLRIETPNSVRTCQQYVSSALLSEACHMTPETECPVRARQPKRAKLRNGVATAAVCLLSQAYCACHLGVAA